MQSDILLPPVPYNLTLRKGSRHVVLQRSLADRYRTHPVAIALNEWLKDAGIPDEIFFSTLHAIKWDEVDENDLEHTVKQDLEPRTFSGGKSGCLRKQLWRNQESKEQACEGKIVRQVCNVSIKDLEYFRESDCVFGNKFNLKVSPEAPLCQFEYLANLDDV